MQFNDGTYWDGVNINNVPILSVEAIAHALSNICRYGGHVRIHYSVAQHSVAIAAVADPMFFKEAMLHDASEAYIGDIPAPMKHQIPEIKKFEEGIQRRIFEEYGLRWPIPNQIEYLDKAITQTEMQMFFDKVNPYIQKMLLEKTNGVQEFFLIPELEEAWPAEKAKQEFIRRFYEYEQYNVGFGDPGNNNGGSSPEYRSSVF